MKMNDDMQVFSYIYKDNVYHYRLLDSNIKTSDKGKSFNYSVTVWEAESQGVSFTVSFRLFSEEIDLACRKTEEEIRKYIEG